MLLFPQAISAILCCLKALDFLFAGFGASGSQFCLPQPGYMLSLPLGA